jgi:hypothetical protein
VRLTFKDSSLIEAFFLDCLTLNMKTLRSFYTSVTVYKSTRRSTAEGLNFQQHRCEKLKSARSLFSEFHFYARNTVGLLLLWVTVAVLLRKLVTADYGRVGSTAPFYLGSGGS